MKVAHLIASTGLYGAEKWILALMRAMQSSNVKSVLVNLSDAQHSVSAVVTGARDRSLEAVDFYTGGTFNPFSIIRFSRWLKDQRIDIVHGHGYKSDIIGLVAARLVGCKIITTPHGWSKETDKKLMLYETIDLFTFRFMDYVCPLSNTLMESVKNYTNSNQLKLVLNGVDIDEIAAQPARVIPMHDFFYIGYIGRLVTGKNLPILVRATKLLHEINIKAKLILVGDGPEKENIHNLSHKLAISDQVEFLGYRNDAISILKSLDVFVLPSLSEGLPRCVMEAMAARVPVVASDIPGTRQLVKHGKTGLLYPPTEEAELVNALFLLFSDKHLRTTLAENAYKLITDNYSNLRMAEEYAWVYSTLMKI